MTTDDLRKLAKAATPGLWKDIPGYEGRYQTSSDGQVRSLRIIKGCVNKLRSEPLILKRRADSGGYQTVSICRVPLTVHSLVLYAFVGPRPEGFEGAHLNGDKQDCRLENLAWVSRIENARHKFTHGTQPLGERCQASVLTDAQAAEILRSYNETKPVKGKGWYSKMQSKYGVSFGCLNKLVLRTAWKHIHDQ